MQYTMIASVCVYFVTGWRAGAGGSLLMRSQIGFKEVYGAAPKTSAISLAASRFPWSPIVCMEEFANLQ